MHDNLYGRFIEGGRAFEITDPRTPMPWTNVVCNGRYGFVVSQNGGGFSWLDHCQLNVVTRWEMDLARDDHGRFLYLADLDAPEGSPGRVWSASPHPCRTAFDAYRCVHRPGSTSFETEANGVRAHWTLACAPDDTCEVWRVRLTNDSGRPRRLRAAAYFEWCCGTAPDVKREFHRLFFDTAYDADRRAIVATKCLWEAPFGDADDHWNRGWPHAAAMGVAGADEGTDLAIADKGSFLGRYGDPARPLALTHDEPRPGRFGRFGDAVCALGGDVSLEPGETRTLVYVLAVGDDPEGALRLVERYADEGACSAAIERSERDWAERLERTRVRTGRTDFDLLNQTWLPYQAISARLWGRTGYFQQSGAFGFRDQLQDSQVWLPLEPDRCAAQIMHHAAHQFADGTVYHWWNPITETGNHTKCSDDYLWLPFVTGAYVRETGDASILGRTARFVDDERPATLLDHCGRAIERSLARFGPNGLPLIGDMDWNDGLSALGTDDAGESVWLAIFLCEVLDRFGHLLELAGEDGSRYAAVRRGLAETVNRVAWDGDWYKRATDRRGRWLGSSECDDGQLYLNPQSWAILTGVASEDRAERAWASVREHLVTDYGPLLLAPAYTVPDPEIGYITRYAPGARENGGVYMHAATWALAAACRLKDVATVERIWASVSPPVRGSNPEGYHAEPYVLPGNVDGPLSDLPGRAGWTWYTGSAAWLNRVSLEWILGIRPEWGGLVVDPCPMPSLGRVDVTRVWRGRRVRVRFDATEFAPGLETRIVVNGNAYTRSGMIRAEDLPPEGDVEIDVGWGEVSQAGVPRPAAAAAREGS